MYRFPKMPSIAAIDRAERLILRTEGGKGQPGEPSSQGPRIKIGVVPQLQHQQLPELMGIVVTL